MNGEAGSAEVDTADVQNQLKEVKEALRGYEPRDIYNMDETGLYYRSAPTRTLSQKPVSGVKVDKTRMSVAFFCNADDDGSSKIAPVIIGNHEKPRCFKKRLGLCCKLRFVVALTYALFILLASDLGFHYYFNKKAWMNRVHFRKIMGRFNNRAKKENRNVALMLDNAPVHDRDLNYSNVKLVFLPPNTTSHYQPLDARIIANFKYWYRKPQYKYVAIKHSHTEKEINDNADGGDNEHAEEKLKPFFWIDQLQATKWILFAWNKVSEGNTITNCWRHTGLLEQEKSFFDAKAIEEMEKLDPLEGFIAHEDGTVEVEDQQFDFDENQHLFEGDEDSSSEFNLSVNNEEEDGEDAGVSSEAAVDAMKLILENVAPTTDDELYVMECLSKMFNSYRSEMIANRTTQTKIDPFFNKNC